MTGTIAIATEDDPTEINLSPDPKIVATKSASVTTDNGDGFLGPGDTITFTSNFKYRELSAYKHYFI